LGKKNRSVTQKTPITRGEEKLTGAMEPHFQNKGENEKKTKRWGEKNSGFAKMSQYYSQQRTGYRGPKRKYKTKTGNGNKNKKKKSQTQNSKTQKNVGARRKVNG